MSKELDEAIAPTNAAGAGNVAGVGPGDKPPVRLIRRMRKKLKDKEKRGRRLLRSFTEYREAKNTIREAVRAKKVSNKDKLTPKDFKEVERFADRLAARHGIDVAFTKHFKERVNHDNRNRKPITVQELMDFFQDIFNTKGKKLGNAKDGFEAVLKDLQRDLNMPFKIVGKRGDLDMVTFTIMRTKRFFNQAGQKDIKI